MKKGWVVALFFCLIGCNDEKDCSCGNDICKDSSDISLSSDSASATDDTASTAADTLDSATGIDTVTGSETVDTDTVSDTGSDTDTGSGSDTVVPDTGLDCGGMAWQCGVGVNDKGFDLNCDGGALGCAKSGELCDNHQCTVCNTDAHCGPACSNCGEGNLIAFPRCLDGASCVECLQDSDCPTDRPACDTDNHVCVQCTTNA
ncbi:MAG: hypothetical protein JXR76_12225, partial [Deltaproteobacteria bacterium]|nr:hypothetical protein [Deltaproteobacteria bacterium]